MQAVVRKFGKDEDEHVVASDAELDTKLDLFKSIDETTIKLQRLIEHYQDRLCSKIFVCFSISFSNPSVALTYIGE
jgi:hypothetical protein